MADHLAAVRAHPVPRHVDRSIGLRAVLGLLQVNGKVFDTIEREDGPTTSDRPRNVQP